MNHHALTAQSNLTKMREIHTSFLRDLRIYRESIKTGTLAKEALADLGLGLKDLVELADDLKKEAAAVLEDASDAAALMWSLEAVSAKKLGPIQGEIAIGVVKQKVYPKLPSKSREPERHQMLMEAVGLKPEADASIFSISWPRLVERLSADYAAGKPLPAGILPDELMMKPKLEIRRRPPQH